MVLELKESLRQVFIGESLKVNETLTELNLRFNQIGIEGAKSIGEALKTNETLTNLDLHGNTIGIQGEPPAGVHWRIIKNK
jgi:Ran GTPase-activating protein (RanGAP) involved in mRNA processing and transport